MIDFSTILCVRQSVLFLNDSTILWQEFEMGHAIAIEENCVAKPLHLTELDVLFSVLALLDAFFGFNVIAMHP